MCILVDTNLVIHAVSVKVCHPFNDAVSSVFVECLCSHHIKIIVVCPSVRPLKEVSRNDLTLRHKML